MQYSFGCGFLETYNSRVFEVDADVFDTPQIVTDLITDPAQTALAFYPDYDDPNNPEIFRGGNLIWFRYTYHLELATKVSVLQINPTLSVEWTRNGPATDCPNQFDCFSIQIASTQLRPPVKTIEAWTMRTADADRTISNGLTHYNLNFPDDRHKIDLTISFKFKLFRPNDVVTASLCHCFHHWIHELPSIHQRNIRDDNIVGLTSPHNSFEIVDLEPESA